MRFASLRSRYKNQILLFSLCDDVSKRCTGTSSLGFIDNTIIPTVMYSRLGLRVVFDSLFYFVRVKTVAPGFIIFSASVASSVSK